jgi:hypothetical protein
MSEVARSGHLEDPKWSVSEVDRELFEQRRNQAPYAHLLGSRRPAWLESTVANKVFSLNTLGVYRQGEE